MKKYCFVRKYECFALTFEGDDDKEMSDQMDSNIIMESMQALLEVDY